MHCAWPHRWPALGCGKTRMAGRKRVWQVSHLRWFRDCIGFTFAFLHPLPEALRKRILNLEYVDMANLQPEAWLFEDGTQDKAITSIFKKRSEPVTDILVWVQCYNVLVGVLTERFPQFIHHFLAYQSHIIRSYKKSRALEWVAYDMAYRELLITVGIPQE